MMTSRLFLYAPQPTKGGRRLARKLGAKRIKANTTVFIGSQDTIINWGRSAMWEGFTDFHRIINRPCRVALVANKLLFFQQQYLADTKATVPWTTDPFQAESWRDSGHYIVVRHKLTGHSGQGIEIVKESMPMPNAPLYTMYKPKKHEFRIHIMGSEIVDMQQKKRRMEVPNDEVDWLVRSHRGGFVYARQDLEVPACVTEVALSAFGPTGLDFGAVDVVYQANTGRAYVLEINSAPGLEGTTLVRYVEGLKKIVAIN